MEIGITHIHIVFRLNFYFQLDYLNSDNFLEGVKGYFL